MQHELFRLFARLLRALGRRRHDPRQVYTDATILEVFLWAVICDRPVSWACEARHWPPGLRRGPLPSQSLVSRRLRTPSVIALRAKLEARVLGAADRPALACVIDGKALTVARHSTDPHAGFGYGTGAKAKGYKLHMVIDLAGRPLVWRLAPLDIGETTIARRLLRDLPPCAYLLADTNYDSNALFAQAAARGIQLVAPRRHGGPGRGLGHIRQHPARVRSMALTEHDGPGFARDLCRQRRRIERFFASLCAFGGGLTGLPPWVRTYPRVHAWVQIKLIIAQLRNNRVRTTMPKRVA